MTGPQAAEALGISNETVKKQLAITRSKLKANTTAHADRDRGLARPDLIATFVAWVWCARGRRAPGGSGSCRRRRNRRLRRRPMRASRRASASWTRSARTSRRPTSPPSSSRTPRWGGRRQASSRSGSRSRTGRPSPRTCASRSGSTRTTTRPRGSPRVGALPGADYFVNWDSKLREGASVLRCRGARCTTVAARFVPFLVRGRREVLGSAPTTSADTRRFRFAARAYSGIAGSRTEGLDFSAMRLDSAPAEGTSWRYALRVRAPARG